MFQKLIIHKDKIILMKLAILQIFISFFTNFLIVKKIGFTAELDIFYLAMGVYLFLTTSIGWSISSVLTPILIENEDKSLEGQMFINVFIIALSVFLFAFFSSYIWIDLIYFNFKEYQYNLIFNIQSIFIITFFFDILNLVFISILQKMNYYIKINFINLISVSMGFLTVVLFLDDYFLYTAAFSHLIVRLSVFLILGIYLFNTIKKTFYFDKYSFFLLWNRMKHIFVGSLYFRMGDLVDRLIASYLVVGFLSLTSFVQKIYESINTVINSSIVAPTITKFSYLVKEKNFLEIKKIYIKYIFFLFFINLIILFFVILTGEVLFKYFFSEKLNEYLSSILLVILVTLFVICFSQTIGKIIQNLLLSLGKEKEIMKYDIITFTISIVIKLLLTLYYGVYGFLTAYVLSEIIKYSAKYYLAYKILKVIK